MELKRVLKYCLVISVISAFIFIELYRAYIQLHNINDYYLSDVAANLFGFFPLNFLFWYISGKTKLSQVLLIPIAIAFGFILYEFLQILIPRLTFDYYDIFATIISMLLCLPINFIILKFVGNKNKINDKNH